MAIALLLAYVAVVRGEVDGRYWHARRRLAKGLRPMAYHAWMIPYVRFLLTPLPFLACEWVLMVASTSTFIRDGI